MKTQDELKRQLKQIDHKGYKAYKTLEGEYSFGAYILCIDHVQGDPFATPSRVRLLYKTAYRRSILKAVTGKRLRRIISCGASTEI